MICPVSGPPLTVRISVTDRCQLRCRYCMPAEGIACCAHEQILTFEEIVLAVESLQLAFDVRKVRLTGGDPLARRGIEDLVSMLAELNIPDVAMTTNGQCLAQAAARLRAAGLDRVNVSLDSLDPDTFRCLTRGGVLRRTLEGIDATIASGMRPVKLNTVVMKGINDGEACDLLTFALGRGCELRFLEVMPIGYGAALFETAFVRAASVRESLASQFALTQLPWSAGDTARRYQARRSGGAEGTVGFIAPCSESFCSGCTRLRITADGRLVGCLARGDGIPIRPLLRDPDPAALAAAVRETLQSKRSRRGFAQPVAMSAIGG